MHDVIVIGGGLAGAATTYFLAADGVSTLLLERHDLNTQASGANAGGLHGQIPFEPFAQKGEAWTKWKAEMQKTLCGAQNADGTALDSQQRHRNQNTKTILGRFQGRKSIDRG